MTERELDAKAQKLAAAFGRPVSEAKATLARFLRGSHDALEDMRHRYGITHTALVEAGAEMGNAGRVAMDSAEQMRRATEAFNSVISRLQIRS